MVETGVDQSGLDKGLRAASDKLKSWGASITAMGAGIMAAGAAILTPLLGAAQVFNQMGSALNDASDRTGMAVEDLSALQFAAEQTGATFEDLEKGIGKFQKLIVEAAEGNAEAAKTMEDLGLSASELAKMDPADAVGKLADGIAGIENPAKRAAVAMAAMGKGGKALIPMFKDGAKGLDEIKKAAVEAGVVMSTEDAAAADALGDAFDKLTTQMKFATAHIGSSLAPVLTDLLGMLSNGAAETIKFIKENKALVIAVAGVGVGLVAVGAAITGLGIAMSLAGVAIVGVATAIGLLTSPFALILGATAGLGAAFFTMTESGKNATSEIADSFKDLADIATESWRGISAAISSGDLSQALEIATLGMKAVWTEMLGWMTGKWLAWKGWLESTGWTDWWAGKMAAAGEATGLLPQGTGATLSQMPGVEAEQRQHEADLQSRREAIRSQLSAATIGAEFDAMTKAELARMEAEGKRAARKNLPDIASGKAESAGTFSGAAAALMGLGSNALVDLNRQQLDVQKGILDAVSSGALVGTGVFL